MMILPMSNGQGGTNLVMIPTGSSSVPDEYTSHFKAGDVHVEVTYHTSNKAIADELEKKVIDKLEWKITEEFDDGPTTLLGRVALAVVGGALAAFMLCFVLFIMVVIAQIGDMISFNRCEELINTIIRTGFLGTPFLILALVVGVLFTHDPQK